MLEKLGPYRIGRLIGRGGMGEVYEGVDETTRARVAVKVLSPAMARSEGFRERFEAEVDSLRQLHHPRIVELYGYGEHEGMLFYSMELVEGRSLEDELCSERRFNWREVTEIGIQLCGALKHAHDHGVIHRDLKPANILLMPNDEVKLLDFGIARLFGGAHVTNVGGVLGTADYMSPEQADGRPVNDRCDQYSLGCVLYALATGGPPFTSSSLPKLLQMQRFAKPEPIRKFASDMPEELERIILQLLEKDPEKRFPNVLVLQRQLSAMLRALSRPVEPDDFQVHQAADLSPTPPPGGDALAITRVPGEEWELDAPRSDLTQDLRPTEPAPETTSSAKPTATRFTNVQEELERERRDQTDSWISLLAPLGLLIGALAILVGGVWYALRPATADELYATIEAAAADENPDSLARTSDEVAEFLTRFPDDPRRGEIAAYAEELDLKRAERRLRLMVRHARPGAELSPLESTYIEAMRQVEVNPARAVEQLQAILDLHDGEEKPTTNQRQCLSLVRRQIARLQKELQTDAEEHLDLLQARLAAADQLHGEQPQQAKQIWRAIVELYGDKPWAAKAVAEARQQLGESESR